MARKKISAQFRARLSEKLMDLGNYVAVGLVIAQFVSGSQFDLNRFLVGMIVTGLCYVISYIISK